MVAIAWTPVMAIFVICRAIYRETQRGDFDILRVSTKYM